MNTIYFVTKISLSKFFVLHKVTKLFYVKIEFTCTNLHIIYTVNKWCTINMYENIVARKLQA